MLLVLTTAPLARQRAIACYVRSANCYGSVRYAEVVYDCERRTQLYTALIYFLSTDTRSHTSHSPRIAGSSSD